MTSLSRQLENLRTAATSSLAPQRVRVSLLYDKKEAAGLDRETFYKIGIKGYTTLCKLDKSLDQVAPDFFEEGAMQFQRGQLTAEENKALDEKIERFLFRLCPYAQHFSCHEVLEWLIHRYEIHSYNAELLLKTFMPFHNSNFFGRLLYILDIKKTSQWAWLKPFAERASAVPLSRVVQEGMRVSSSIMNVVTGRINRAVELLGDEFVAKNLNVWFAFYTQLLLKMFEDNTLVNDQLISKVIPSIAVGLKSSLSHFRHGALAGVCQLAMAVPLTEAVNKTLLKACLMKLKDEWMDASLCSVVVLCQRQDIKEFSKKSLLKIIRKGQYKNVCQRLKEIASHADLTKFFSPLWKSLFEIASEAEEGSEELKHCYDFIEIASQPTEITNKQAAKFFSIFVQHFSELPEAKLPKNMRKNTRALILRFVDEFNVIRAEWLVRDKKLVSSLLDQCKVTEDEVGGQLDVTETNRQKRRRLNSLRKSITEDPTLEFEIPKAAVLTAEDRIAKMAKSQIPVASKERFSDSLSAVCAFLKNSKWEEARWAFESINDKYLKEEDNHDIENFIKTAVAVGSRQAEIKNDVRNLLAKMEIKGDLFAALLGPQSTPQPKRKNAKVTQESAEPEPSTSTDHVKQIEFALEILVLSKRISCSQALLRRLFIVQSDAFDRRDSDDTWASNLQLSMQGLIKLLKNPGQYKVSPKDLALDPIIQGIRTTDDHRFLRDALKLLTAAVSINSVSVVKQVMSVFTFMGAGLLKKDNDVTLEILEETLNVLFRAVFSDVKSQAGRDRLLALSRILAVSLSDIPAHRRMRVVKAVGRSVGSEYIWVVVAVLFDEFCQKWQRPAGDAKKDGRGEGDTFDDMATEMIGSYEPEVQLQCAVDLLSYVIRLGGDLPGSGPAKEDFVIFDRNSAAVQKLRHFRFYVFGWVAKFLTYAPLYEQLAVLDDEELYTRFADLGKRLFSLSIELDVFVGKQVEYYERDFVKRRREDPETKAPQTLKYWIALSARSDTVSERFRNLLPAGVSGRLIGDILADDNTDPRIRDKSLQLLNTKMMQDGVVMEESHLLGFVEKLNAWLKPAESKEEIALCQNAAFSLKLIAKRIPTVGSTNLLSTTMGRCAKILKEWNELDEAMVGSILLLCGEIVRSHNMRSTMLSAENLLGCCMDILKETYSRPMSDESSIDAESVSAKRQRVTSRTLAGKNYSSDVLLVCALTCLQRIMDQFAAFITQHYSPILNLVCCLTAKYDPELIAVDSSTRVSNSVHRLEQIRKAFVKIELRLLLKPVEEALKSLSNKPREIVSLFQILGSVIDTAASKDIKKNLSRFVEIFFAAFEVRKFEHVGDRFDIINKCEATIIDVFLKLIDSMSDNEVKPVMNSLIKWGSAGLSEGASLANRLRIITMFHFANKFFDSYHALCLPYFTGLFDLCPKVLKSCNTATNSEKKLLFACLKNSNPLEKLSANEVIVQVLEFVTKSAKHPDYFVRERADEIYEAVVDELENVKCFGHEQRCVPLLSNCLYQIAEAHTQLFSTDMINRIMDKTRSTSEKIRYRTLLVTDKLLDRVGDAVAPLLPNILPYLSELLEDDNRQVEEQCDKTLRMIRTKFGSELAEGMA